MVRLLAGVPAFALVISLGTAAPTQDKKDEKKAALTGTWVRESNGLDLKLDFSAKDNTFKLSAFGGENGVIVTCKYAVEKDVVKAEITGVEEKGSFPAKPPKGLAFSFKWTVKKDVATLDDLKGEGLEDAKPVLEGDFTPAKKKKD